MSEMFYALGFSPSVHYVDTPACHRRPDGFSRKVVVALVPTARGWSSRSSLSDEMRHDYECDDIDEVTGWLDQDLCNGWSLTTSREEALEYLATTLSISPLPATALVGNPSVPVAAATERVLQHLEHGY